eukprot:jgi/Botrbrau1/22561/Bobra.0566s0002.1
MSASPWIEMDLACGLLDLKNSRSSLRQRRGQLIQHVSLMLLVPGRKPPRRRKVTAVIMKTVGLMTDNASF